MSEHDFSCISPADGRYAATTKPLRDYFSEKSLIRYRIFIEIEYLIALFHIPLPELLDLPGEKIPLLRNIYKQFDDDMVVKIKEIEKTTNHDIKAIEYFLKTKIDELGLSGIREFIHFGLTSQDVNNTAIPLSLKEGIQEQVIPALEALLSQLSHLSSDWMEVVMLGHTHGQPASPTTVGKELLVFHERLKKQLNQLKKLPYPAKFAGATGNFNAHHAAYPDIDWVDFANRFVGGFGLERSQVTTQIDHYDGLSAIFDCLKRICTIIIDLDRDCWSYISMKYFSQKIKAGETGSSAMPHKVNPIDFENAEGNAGVAIALFEHLSVKLPVSRLQRDLTDSTVLRNIGLPVAHLFIAIHATMKGLNKIIVNKVQINKDLEENRAVIAEGIQTIMRKLKVPEPYEKLKALTRNDRPVSQQDIDAFIDALDINETEKLKMKQLTPFNYTGILPL